MNDYTWHSVIFAGMCGCLTLFSLHLVYQNKKLKRILAHNKLELNAARRTESLGTLAGGIAHDFNNILGSILGFSALLEEDLAASPALREMAQHITAAATRGQSIVRQLMAYTRRLTDEHGAAYAEVSLPALVSEAVALIRPSMRASTHIEWTPAAKTPHIHGDSTNLVQVILNLLVNADHAIGARAGRIRLTMAQPSDVSHAGGIQTEGFFHITHGRFQAGEYIALAIQDNGIGMDEKTLKRICEPFFTTKPVDEGTGLGLSAVLGILLDHGGVMTVHSKPMAGSIFTLYFPVV